MKGFKVVLLASFALSSTLVPMQGASAATTGKVGSTWVKVNDHWYKVAETTAIKIKTAPWTITRTERAQIGQTPGKASAPAGVTPQTTVADQPGTVRPMAMAKCISYGICVQTYGSGLYISAWDTQWNRAPGAMLCVSETDVWGNGSHWVTSNISCGTGGFYTAWSPARNFAAGGASSYYTVEQPFYFTPSVYFTIHA